MEASRRASRVASSEGGSGFCRVQHGQAGIEQQVGSPWVPWQVRADGVDSGVDFTLKQQGNGRIQIVLDGAGSWSFHSACLSRVRDVFRAPGRRTPKTKHSNREQGSKSGNDTAHQGSPRVVWGSAAVSLP